MKATADHSLVCGGIKQARPFNDKNFPQLIRLYKKGWTLAALKRKWHCYGNQLARLLVEAGVYRKSRPSAAPEYYVYLALRGRMANFRFAFKSFDQFLNEVGPRPSAKHWLRKIDRNGYYAPGNLQWSLLHLMSRTPEYQTYSSAKQRCTNPNGTQWKYYGGRGIQFRFASFEEFLAELGPRPTEH